MIEHLKSGLSISTHVGCPLGCKYCILSIIKDYTAGPILNEHPTEIMNNLMSKKALFVNGRTPLLINNRTDPLLQSVKESTKELLKLCIRNKISSPILIISKFPPDSELSYYFDKLNLIYIYSYSGYKSDFNYDKLSKDTEQICNLVPKSSRFHYLRPIIPHVNDNPEDLLEILDYFANAHFCGSIIAGFRVNKENVNLLQQQINYDNQHKILSSEFYPLLVDHFRKKRSEYQLFRHTSCGICYYMKEANRLNYYNKVGHCSSYCANYAVCSIEQKTENAIVKGFIELHLPFLKKWKFNDNVLYINQEVNQEHIAFICNALGVYVKCEHIVLSTSEELLTSK